MLYVRGNNDTDDAEYYVNHLMFRALNVCRFPLVRRRRTRDILDCIIVQKAPPRWLPRLRKLIK